MINVKKTREMIIGRALKVSIPPVVLKQRADPDTFKLLGVYISNDLKWGQHVNVILSKAASRLYFLKQLRRAGAGTGDLLCFFNMIVRRAACSGVRQPSMALKLNSCSTRIT